jgi:cytochrome c-type biogenesis protein CcmF
LATFSLTILGTFLTRSAVLNSLHSFTDDGGVGPALLAFFGVIVAVSIGLLAWRGDQLRTSGPVALASREGAFLLNNFLFGAFAFVVLLGTVFPLFTEAFNGSSVSIGPPYFDLSSMPIVVCLLFLMAVAPVLPWRQSTAQVLGRRLLWPAAAAAVTLVACVAAGVRGFWPLVVFGLAAFAGGSALRQLALLVRARGISGALGRSGGGMVVHLGIVAMAVAFTASSAYAQQSVLTVSPGRPAHFDGHTFVYRGIRTVGGPGRSSLVATVLVDGRAYHPAVEQFALNNSPVISPSYHSTLTEDILLNLASTPTRAKGPISLDVTIKPLVIWLWLGAAVVVTGSAMALVPVRRSRRRRSGRALDDEDMAAGVDEQTTGPAAEEATPVGAAV